MKKDGTKRPRRSLLPIAVCIVTLAAVAIGLVYFGFISQRIYEDSALHLEELYSQVNRAFGSFVNTNWGLLRGWGDVLAQGAQTEDAQDFFEGFIEEQRAYWGFSEFYFLSSQHTGRTLSGAERPLELEGMWPQLLEAREPLLVGETLEGRQGITVFAVPVQRGSVDGFTYDAIAVSYTNADLASQLKIDAFSGKAKCFVIHSDGSVLLSAQNGGGVFSSYLVYLQAASDLSEEALRDMQEAWRAGQSGLVQCRIGDVVNCVLYQPVGYADYMLLSVVPRDVMSAGFVTVQKTTSIVMGVIFLLLVGVLCSLFAGSNQRLRRRSRAELQYRDRMFDVLSNSVDDIFMMLDSDDHSVDYVSPNVERLLGVPAEDVRKDIRALKACMVNDDALYTGEELSNIPLNGNARRECEYMHQSTGERRWYRMTLYHMSIQDTRKYIVVLSDRTQEQQMKQKLEEALNAAQSANEAKSNFLSNMSHDIRTPMNAIVGFSVLLEKDADDPQKVREYIGKIRASSQHLLSLINDVLDMSKIESGKTSLNVGVFSLPALLEELNIILMSQVKAKRQTFEIHVQGTPPEQLMGDRLRLNQILINLLSNAVKYTQEGGKIEFLVSTLPQSTPQRVGLRFVVRDNGIGMSEEFQKEIFKPFSREVSSVTNTVQGTGLGMAITKNLVDLMGGVITVESQIGQGSTFTVELSFARAPQEASLQPGMSSVAQRIARMLVADDEEDICLSIVAMMQGTGIDVFYATSGYDAIQMTAQAHARGEDFHLILLDWKMPGIDGVETARRIREQVGDDVPILVLTSYDWADIETKAREAGINAFMPKPFFVSTFLKTVEPLFASLPESPKEDGEEQALSGRLFLVAEDNELNAEILTEMLDIEGAACDVAVNGQEAVRLFEASSPGHYDMILMDVQMPVMNGYEATRAIRASAHPEARRIPIVAMTANTFAEDVRNALDAGMDGHLAKPIDMNAVRRTVLQLLSRWDEERARDLADEGGTDA